MKKINVADITLKKISEDHAVSLLFREKSAIANCADRLGADRIELPAVKNIREDSIVYKTIAKNVQNAALVIPVGFSAEAVAEAWECIKDAKKPCLQVELPVSTIQMEYAYHVKQAKMLEKIGEMVSAAKELCGDVEFSALDATRADEDFLLAAIKSHSGPVFSFSHDIADLRESQITHDSKINDFPGRFIQVLHCLEQRNSVFISLKFPGNHGTLIRKNRYLPAFFAIKLLIPQVFCNRAQPN